MSKRAIFKCLYEDNQGGKWIRRVGPGRHHIIELIDMDDACGLDNEGRPTYNVELSEVDVIATVQKTKADAIKSCGWENMELSEVALAECLHSYGARAPLDSWDGNNRGKLLRDARALSSELDDPETHEEYMNRPVNALGSTAREFAQGDFCSAITRGVRADNPNAKIMAKLYGASEEQIKAVQSSPASSAIAAQVNLHKVPSDDPLAS